MAYTPAILILVAGPIGGSQGPRHFAYSTGADADATIVGAGYFSDGVLKGMRAGDIIDVIATTGPKYKRYRWPRCLATPPPSPRRPRSPSDAALRVGMSRRWRGRRHE